MRQAALVVAQVKKQSDPALSLLLVVIFVGQSVRWHSGVAQGSRVMARRRWDQIYWTCFLAVWDFDSRRIHKVKKLINWGIAPLL